MNERRVLTIRDVLLIVAPLVPVWAFRLINRYPSTVLAEMFVVFFSAAFTFLYLCSIAMSYGSVVLLRAALRRHGRSHGCAECVVGGQPFMGAMPTACGWVEDHFGLSWQIVPKRFSELIGEPCPAILLTPGNGNFRESGETKCSV